MPLSKEEIVEIQDFVSQKFDIVEITDETRKSVPTGRYVHVGVVGHAIHFLIRLLADRKETKP